MKFIEKKIDNQTLIIIFNFFLLPSELKTEDLLLRSFTNDHRNLKIHIFIHFFENQAEN